ncbi:MAG: hypothetical protein WCB12_00025 [Bryobacteraceae bacterium]
MRNILRITAPAALLALAGSLWGGGFYLMLGNPDASPEARKLNAVVTVKSAGCVQPRATRISATAIGTINGERREIPLKLEPLSTPGMFALAQQWPKQGRWVIRLEATNGSLFASSLLMAGPDGVDRYHDKAGHTPFSSADIEAMLRQ